MTLSIRVLFPIALRAAIYLFAVAAPCNVVFANNGMLFPSAGAANSSVGRLGLPTVPTRTKRAAVF